METESKTDTTPRTPASFLEAIHSRIVLADGAMGTELYQRGIYTNQCFEGLNLTRANLVAQVHRAYIEAGAELIETNTYGANRLQLQHYGLGESVAAINREAVHIARAEAKDQAWVAASIGPPRAAEEDDRAGNRDDVAAAYREQISALAEAGVDVLLFETFSNLHDLEIGVKTAREIAPDLPIVAQVMFMATGKTAFGETPEVTAKVLDGWPVDVIGTNCGAGPAELVRVIEQMRGHTNKPLSIQPNAGSPVRHEGRYLYLATPEYFMEYLRRAIVHGAHLIGACCGSNPDHIRAIKSSIKMLQPGRPEKTDDGKVAVSIVTEEAPRRVFEPILVETPSALAAKLRAGKFVVSIEIDPPIGTDPAPSLKAMAACRDAGVDCINIADGPRATARMGPIDMALLLRQHVPGIEPIVHFCCRDRNILGLQADMIGANALGLHNILIITGDPPKLGDYPFATAVYDVDSIGSLKIGNHLNHGEDLAGNPLKGPATQIHLGCGANPGSQNLDVEIARLERKVEAGANYIMTQPVYDEKLFWEFHRRIEHIKVPLLLGILPLASLRNAEFLTREVPGMQVPDPILERLRKCTDKESARQEGINISREALEASLDHIAGVYIMPPFSRVDTALAVVEVAKRRRR